MESLYERVRYLVNKHDPCHLIEHHGGIDAYRPEVEQIIPAMRTTKKPDILQEKIHAIFKEIVGEENAGPKVAYLPLAQDILELQKQKR